MPIARLDGELMKDFNKNFLSFPINYKENLIKRINLIDVPIYVWVTLALIWLVLVGIKYKLEKKIADAPYDINKLQFITKSEKSKTE